MKVTSEGCELVRGNPGRGLGVEVAEGDWEYRAAPTGDVEAIGETGVPGAI